MNKTFYLVPGNSGKFKELSTYLQDHAPELTIIQKDLDIPEVQSLDQQLVATEKARAAYALLQHPLIVDDGGIYLDHYNNFPGPLAKFVMQGIGIEGLLRLAKGRPECTFRTTLAVALSAEDIHLFEGSWTGKLLEQENYTMDPALPYRPFFVPDGYDVPYDKLDHYEIENVHHRMKALKSFLDWYKKQ